MDTSMAAVPFVSGQCVQRHCLQTLFVTAHVSQREQETLPYVAHACLDCCENNQPSSNSAVLMNATQNSDVICNSLYFLCEDLVLLFVQNNFNTFLLRVFN